MASSPVTIDATASASSATTPPGERGALGESVDGLMDITPGGEGGGDSRASASGGATTHIPAVRSMRASSASDAGAPSALPKSSSRSRYRLAGVARGRSDEKGDWSTAASSEGGEGGPAGDAGGEGGCEGGGLDAGASSASSSLSPCASIIFWKARSISKETLAQT
eukprot:1808553-Prymnesium_polylepis.2